MGLDSVELLMAVEETFQISFSDDEAQKIVTVGDFYQGILIKLGDGKSPDCLSRWTFYQIRWAFMNQLNLPRAQIKLETKLDEIIPMTNRIAIWEKLAQVSTFTLPRLHRPVWMQWLIGVPGIVLFLGSVFFVFKKNGYINSMLFVASVLIPVLIYKLTQQFAVCFSRESVTVKNLVKSVLQLNYGAIAKAKAKWNEQEVWNVLQGIIVEQLGVKLEKVTKDARIVKDLGAE